MIRTSTARIAERCAVALALAALLAGCAPLLVGGAIVGGSLVATDRRTAGIQLEDQGIELRAAARVRELATLGQVSVTSYNRTVLVTGEVPTVADRQRVVDAVSRVENVRSVVDELVVAPNSPLGSRSADAVLAGRVKGGLIDAKDLQANAFNVVVERRVVYLMGRVTEREAARAAEVAAGTPGTQKVVRVLEIMTEDELAQLGRAAGASAAAASAPAARSTPPR